MFISYKANDVKEETEAAKKALFLLGGKCKEIQEFDLLDMGHRSFVKIEKEKKTPASYPRKAGVPSKDCTRFGFKASFRIAVIAPSAFKSLAVTTSPL